MSFKNILNLRAKSDLKFEMIDNNFIERVNIEYYLKLFFYKDLITEVNQRKFLQKIVPILIVSIKKIEFDGPCCYLHFIDDDKNPTEIRGSLLNYQEFNYFKDLDKDVVLLLHNVPFVRLNIQNRRCFHVSFKSKNIARIYKFNNEINVIERFKILVLDTKILNENILEFEKIYPSFLNQ